MKCSNGQCADLPPPKGKLRKWLPLIIIAVLMASVFIMGWHEHLSFKTIGLNYQRLMAFIEANFAIALSIYILAYIAVVALSLPGGLIMTLAGGLLFGWVIAAPATIFGATVGATIIFLAARSSLGDALAAKAGPWVCKLKNGFKENALSYLLFLRLVPVFPFVVVNVVPALLGVPLGTYILGTLLGIIPGTYAFCVAGAGLGSVIAAQNRIYKECLANHPENASACPYTVDTSALVTKELLLAFALLGIVALIPVIIKKWSKRNAAV